MAFSKLHTKAFSNYSSPSVAVSITPGNSKSYES